MFSLFNLFSKLNFLKDYTQISKYIFIGNKYISQNKNFFQNNNIKVVVNCSKNIDFLNLNKKIYKYRIYLDDDLAIHTIALMSLYMKKLIPIINNHINKKHKILIHCKAGMQRSTSFVAALLMYRYNIQKNFAMKTIKHKRSCAFFPLPNFNLSLHLYQDYLINKSISEN